MPPLGERVIREKKRVAFPVVLVTRTLIRDDPMIDSGAVNSLLTIKALCPGKKAGLKPATFERTEVANAPAAPIPGRDEIALGIPPTG